MNTAEHPTQDQIANGAQVLANELLKKHKHAVVLDILMVAYMSIAEAHPCCTQTSANIAVQCGMKLAALAQSKPAHMAVH